MVACHGGERTYKVLAGGGDLPVSRSAHESAGQSGRQSGGQSAPFSSRGPDALLLRGGMRKKDETLMFVCL